LKSKFGTDDYNSVYGFDKNYNMVKIKHCGNKHAVND